MLDANLTLSGSMRAQGEAVGLIALECAVDEMAEKIGLAPSNFAAETAKKDPEQGIPFSSRKLVACMEREQTNLAGKNVIMPNLPVSSRAIGGLVQACRLGAG